MGTTWTRKVFRFLWMPSTVQVCWRGRQNLYVGVHWTGRRELKDVLHLLVFIVWTLPVCMMCKGSMAVEIAAYHSFSVLDIEIAFFWRDWKYYVATDVKTSWWSTLAICITESFNQNVIIFGTEVHDEGATAQEVVHKAVGQGVLVHPVGGASFTDRRKFRNFLRIAQTVWLHQFQYCSLTLVWAGNDFGRCQPTELQEAVQNVVAFASDCDVRLRLVDVLLDFLVELSWWLNSTNIAVRAGYVYCFFHGIHGTDIIYFTININ